MVKFFRRIFRIRKTDLEFEVGKVPLTNMERATAARAALSNAVFDEAFKELIKEAFVLWQKTQYEDCEGRENLWRHIKALHQLRGRLERYISDVLLEEDKLKRQANKAP